MSAEQYTSSTYFFCITLQYLSVSLQQDVSHVFSMNSSTLNISVNCSSILKINDSFRIFRTSRFTNSHLESNLTKNSWRKMGNILLQTNWEALYNIFYPTAGSHKLKSSYLAIISNLLFSTEFLYEMISCFFKFNTYASIMDQRTKHSKFPWN